MNDVDPPHQRGDAVRNRAAILDAARRLTARSGAEVSVQDVATEAGVAVGTIYRHWPAKQDLLRSVLVRRLDEVAADAEASDSFEQFFDSVTHLCVRDRPLLNLLDETSVQIATESSAQEGAVVRDRLDSALADLIERAGHERRLRNQVAPNDVRVYLIGLRAALSCPDPDAWRRHHAIYRDGLFRTPP